MTWILILTLWYNGASAEISTVGFVSELACENAASKWRQEMNAAWTAPNRSAICVSSMGRDSVEHAEFGEEVK